MRRTLIAFALCWSMAGTAHARREATFGYPYSRVWTAAVRLMRVDFEATILEKDKDDGYFLFEYRERGKPYQGSVELVTVSQGEQESVRVVLTIQALPTYVESMMIDRLTRKLEQEFGPPRQPKKPIPDAGVNDDESDVTGEAKPKQPSSAKKPESPPAD